MSLFSPPPARPGGALPPDDVNALLRAFYKAQMPEPWPLPEVPASHRAAILPAAMPAKGWPLLRSRLAVAASVALLVGGSLLLAGAFPGRPPAPADGFKVGGASADRRNDPVQQITPAAVPLKVKINESLIQEPGGTTIHVDVIDWPTTPK